MPSWEISDINWIPINGKQTKCSGKRYGVLAAKVSYYAKSIKDQNGVLLGNAKDILGRWREYFKDLLNPVTIAPPNTHEVHLGEENTINATEVFLAVTH